MPWFYRESDQIRGPISSAELQAEARRGVVTGSTLVSRDKAKWVRASNVKGLTFALPPPAPPAPPAPPPIIAKTIPPPPAETSDTAARTRRMRAALAAVAVLGCLWLGWHFATRLSRAEDQYAKALQVWTNEMNHLKGLRAERARVLAAVEEFHSKTEAEMRKTFQLSSDAISLMVDTVSDSQAKLDTFREMHAKRAENEKRARAMLDKGAAEVKAVADARLVDVDAQIEDQSKRVAVAAERLDTAEKHRNRLLGK